MTARWPYLFLLSSVLAWPALAAEEWTEGVDYTVISPAQPMATIAGKVEVTEVFSYGCPVCWRYYKDADALRAHLPANAFMDYLPASFMPAEDWVMFQRAYFAARSLGIEKRTHDAMFVAIWETHELATIDPTTNRPKRNPPTIEDAAKFYARVAGVKTQDFLQAANSFGVTTQMNQADAQVHGWMVGGTPTIVVNGKYRVEPYDDQGQERNVIAIVRFLVKKESVASR